MTPAARVSAAISVLDTALAGAPVEKVLTNWGRRNRYAGSGDRAAVRDLVFDILRQKRSSARAGGFKGDETAPTPRGLPEAVRRPLEVLEGIGRPRPRPKPVSGRISRPKS